MQTKKKGNQWRFGMKAHIGVDVSGLTPTSLTAATRHDLNQLGKSAFMEGAICLSCPLPRAPAKGRGGMWTGDVERPGKVNRQRPRTKSRSHRIHESHQRGGHLPRHQAAGSRQWPHTEMSDNQLMIFDHPVCGTNDRQWEGSPSKNRNNAEMRKIANS